jgi:hypothetical protein
VRRKRRNRTIKQENGENNENKKVKEAVEGRDEEKIYLILSVSSPFVTKTMNIFLPV